MAMFKSAFLRYWCGGSALCLVFASCAPSSTATDGVSGATMPAIVTGLKVRAVSTSDVHLDWSIARSAQSFIVRRSESSGGTFTILGTVPVTSYDDTAVVSGKTYYYEVQSQNGTQLAGESGTVVCKVP